MKTMSTVEARENFAELINQAAYGQRRIVLTRRGKPLAAVIPLADFQDLETPEVATDVTISSTDTGSIY